MNNTQPKKPARFGALIGVAPGDVPVFSSHYPSVDETEYPDHHSYRSYVDGVFMGYKWQCVELARRWLYINRGYIFDDVAMAFDIFKLRSVRVIRDNTRLPLRAFRNGSKRHPEPGCLLIWKAGGEFERTGHVAIVTSVSGDSIRCIEQNVDHVEWHDEKDYSRELKANLGPDGEYHIECSFPDTHILGWVIQTDDDTGSEPTEEVDPKLFELRCREVPHRQQITPWLDSSHPDEAAYLDMMGGHKLTGNPDDQYRYVCISETAHNELRIATNELHNMFMGATNVTLRHDHLLERFDIPRELWPRLRQSWADHGTKMITGRFDFALSKDGIKAYEYNADSASCHLECGKIQLKWSEHVGCHDGWCPGEDLFDELVHVWRARNINGTLHILIDAEPEETYHGLYMKSAMEAAGITVKVITGTNNFRRDKNGSIVDIDGEHIRTVWKTWAWETALEVFRDASKRSSSTNPGLTDVLFDPAIMVYEPLWSLVTSNKAMLAVLWDLFPGSPWLLNTQFDLTESLRTSGYVEKPVAGRSGSNIRIVNAEKDIVESTQGKFDAQPPVYQAYFRMPNIGGHNVQLSTFTVDGKYAGSCARVDPSPIITSHSDLLALRVVDDSSILS